MAPMMLSSLCLVLTELSQQKVSQCNVQYTLYGQINGVMPLIKKRTMATTLRIRLKKETLLRLCMNPIALAMTAMAIIAKVVQSPMRKNGNPISSGTIRSNGLNTSATEQARSDKRRSLLSAGLGTSVVDLLKATTINNIAVVQKIKTQKLRLNIFLSHT